MANKLVSIIIDDFSSAAESLDSVLVYDYGVVDTYYVKDFYYADGSGRGDFSGDFDQVDLIDSDYKYEYTTFWDQAAQYSSISSGTSVDPSQGLLFDELQVDVFSGLTSYYTDQPLHGDYVAEAFVEQLDQNDSNYVLAIDFDSFGQNALDELISGGFYDIVNDFLESFTEPDDKVFFIGLNASFGGDGSLLTEMSSLILDLFHEDIIVVQASPNIGEGYDAINWSQVYENVLNVGAWNTEADGEFAGTTLPAMTSVDIFADGLIDDSALPNATIGFGTSYASPRVLAEIHNWFQQQILPGYDSGEFEYMPQINLPDNVYGNAIDSVVDTISEDVRFNISGEDEISGPIKVLSDDIQNEGLEPKTLPYEYDRIVPPFTLTEVELIEDGDFLTDFDLDLFPSLENVSDFSQVVEFMGLVETYLDVDLFSVNTDESEFVKIQGGDNLILNGASDKISLVDGDAANINLAGGDNLIFSKGDNLTINAITGDATVFWELDEDLSLSVNINQSNITLLIGDKVINDFTALEIIDEKFFINEVETDISVNFTGDAGKFFVSDIYGNIVEIGEAGDSLYPPANNAAETARLTDDEINYEINNEINKIIDDPSPDDISTDHAQAYDQLFADDDTPEPFIFDTPDEGDFLIEDAALENMNLFADNQNTDIAAADKVSLTGAQYNLSFADALGVEDNLASDSQNESVIEIEEYDRSFSETVNEILFATSLDTFYWEDELALISDA